MGNFSHRTWSQSLTAAWGFRAGTAFPRAYSWEWTHRGLLLENKEERPAFILDLNICETALERLHELGYLHGDASRYNFFITEWGVELLDFEFWENASPDSMRKDLESVHVEMMNTSRRGRGSYIRMIPLRTNDKRIVCDSPGLGKWAKLVKSFQFAISHGSETKFLSVSISQGTI